MKTIKLIMFRFFVLAFCLTTGISAYADGTININRGSISGTGLTFADGVLTITTKGTYRIFGNGSPTGNRIVVNNGITATISLENVYISCTTQTNASAFDMRGATVELQLRGSNTLISAGNAAGIQVSQGNIIIDSWGNPGYFSGTLTVTGGTAGAGIGGGNSENNGTITINGGTITANGGAFAAGIGGGSSGSGGIITINGGIVTATTISSTNDPACIGGGANGDAGTISITGGAVIAKGGSGGSIGRGGPNNASSSGSITISGGTIYATGHGIGMSGQNGVTASTATNITQNAVVFANTINPNATIAPNAITKTKFPHTIDNNGNVTIQLGIGATAIFSIHKLIIPATTTITLNTSYNLYFENYGVIQNFGTIQSNTQIINHTTIINNGVINGNVGLNPVKTGILGEWIQDISTQYYYIGNAITPNVTIIKSETSTLIKNQDYIIKSYSNNTNAGRAMVVIEGTGNYAGVMTKAFTINPRPLLLNEEGLPTMTIADIPSSCNYTGDSIKPVITITAGDKTLILDTDYTASYNNNVNPGEASITITGIKNYSGTIYRTFNITYPPDWQSVINVMSVNSNGLGYAYNNNLITINHDGYYQLTGTTTNNRVVVQSGITATIILDSVSITSSNHAFDVSSGSTVTLLLKNSNILQTTGNSYAGLHMPFGGTLIISSADGSGSVNGMLTASGGSHSGSQGAAIGSGANEGITGNITIKGGTINAHGGTHGGAGIGAGENCSGGVIVIDGGIINAYGSIHGAGIGGGNNSSNSGSIVINGGVINANSSSGAFGAGIGGGTNTNMGSIEISGGTINAIGSQYGAAIGGGMNGTGGNITIYEGTVTATGGMEGAGIGGGMNGSGGNIVIYGGNIIANGVSGIGGGHSGGPGTFSMNGNVVVFASSVSDNSPKTKGILFNGNTGIMYDNVDLEEDVTIPSGKTWTIASDQIFEIQPYVTLTNNGIIYNNGEINNYGTIDGSGTIIGNSVFNDDILDEDDYFESYEYEGKMSLKDIFTLNADITGGIVAIIGMDNFDDEDEFFDPNIDVVVRDKETGTIIYEIYQDITSYQYDSKYLEYYPWNVGEGGAFYPSVWNSNDVKASTFAIDKFHKKEYGAGIHPFLSDSIDIVLEVVVYNAMLDQIKIPGVGELYVEWDDEPNPGLLGIIKYDPNKRDCADDKNKNKCPCVVWNKMQTLPSNDSIIDAIAVPHRGVWGKAWFEKPENSKGAIEAVKESGLDIVEIDIMRSYDNEIVASHDYNFDRLSDFSGDEKYWFDQRVTPAWWNPFQYMWWGFMELFEPEYWPLEAHLRDRQGYLHLDSHYLQFTNVLNILIRKNLVALIDIKAVTNDYDAQYRPTPTVKIEYERRTPEGREKVKQDWLLIFKKCYEQASKMGMLDYIAFKTSYTYEEITGRGGISEAQAQYVRFMPMVQPADNMWTRNKALSLIDSWTLNVKNMVIAIETNFNLPNKEGKDSVYFETFTHKNKRYANLFEYVHQKGFRTGYFSEEPVGVRGVSDRYGKWHMPNMLEKKKADHLILMNVPYFNGAVITTDRPDIWKQLMNNANSAQLLSAEISDDITAPNVIHVNKIEQTEITAKYRSGSIIINGLNQDDIGSNLMLYDLQGWLLYKSKIIMEPQMVIAKNLPTGVYILKVSGDRQSSIKLIAN
jgi:hypothetical protein